MFGIRELAEELTTVSWVEAVCSSILIDRAGTVVDPHAKVSMYRRGRCHARQAVKLRDLVPVLREAQPSGPAPSALAATEALGQMPDHYFRMGFHDHVLPEMQRRYALAINCCSWWSDAPAAKLFTDGIANATASLSAFEDLSADIDIVAMSASASVEIDDLKIRWREFGSELG
ncbi:MAG: hypothetical protein KAZ88_05865 [Acidimicrobiia bacterium]|jgi:hypothetical protein|nr:hypothetical protein [Acidimicrobiia bacterium]MBP8180501.1 hypothetical protein [Acidimicrobiia bacterium]